MVGTPPATPVTTPDAEPMVASAVLLLLHTPLGVPLLSVDVEPTQTLAVPVMAAGVGLTVIAKVEKQPVANV